MLFGTLQAILVHYKYLYAAVPNVILAVGKTVRNGKRGVQYNSTQKPFSVLLVVYRVYTKIAFAEMRKAFCANL
jgi:hypothetical protein